MLVIEGRGSLFNVLINLVTDIFRIGGFRLTVADVMELLEWFVIADEVSCPRDLLGEPPRW